MIYMLIFDVVNILAGTYLVITEHYGWAWIPFLLAATTIYKQPKP